MRLPLSGLRRREGLPKPVADAVVLGRGETLLNGAADLDGTAWLVTTNHSLAQVSPEGDLVWQRPWHEIDHGSWNRESDLLTVTWANVDACRALAESSRVPGRSLVHCRRPR